MVMADMKEHASERVVGSNLLITRDDLIHEIIGTNNIGFDIEREKKSLFE